MIKLKQIVAVAFTACALLNSAHANVFSGAYDPANWTFSGSSAEFVGNFWLIVG